MRSSASIVRRPPLSGTGDPGSGKGRTTSLNCHRSSLTSLAVTGRCSPAFLGITDQRTFRSQTITSNCFIFCVTPNNAAQICSCLMLLGRKVHLYNFSYPFKPIFNHLPSLFLSFPIFNPFLIFLFILFRHAPSHCPAVHPAPNHIQASHPKQNHQVLVAAAWHHPAGGTLPCSRPSLRMCDCLWYAAPIRPMPMAHLQVHQKDLCTNVIQ